MERTADYLTDGGQPGGVRSGQSLQVINNAAPVAPMVIMPVMNPAQFLARRTAMYQMLKEVMIDGTDYGTIPGTPKPSLWKPGAEKLLQMFGMTVECNPIEIREEWGSIEREAFFYYRVEAVVMYGSSVVIRYQSIAHSHETKYRYRWVSKYDVPQYLDLAALPSKSGRASEYKFAIDKAETTGKYAKPFEYWQMFRTEIAAGRARPFKKQMGNAHPPKLLDAFEIDTTVYRVPNPEVEDMAHTLLTMAQKRAIVGATRYATNASDVFDVSEAVEEGDVVIDGTFSYIDEEEKKREVEAYAKGVGNGLNGKVVTPEQARKDVEDLYGSQSKKPSRSEAISQIRKAVGQRPAAEKDRPPTDEALTSMNNKLGLLVGAAGRQPFVKGVFEKDNANALNEAQVAAVLEASQELIQAVIGSAEPVGK